MSKRSRIQSTGLLLAWALLMASASFAEDGDVSRFHLLVAAAKEEIREIDAEELRQLMASTPDLVVLDVREREEWNRGFLRGAQHLSRGVLEGRIERHVPDPATPIALYCGSGNRSALAAQNLQKMGYQRVWSVAGGFATIRESGLPVDGSPDEAQVP